MFEKLCGLKKYQVIILCIITTFSFALASYFNVSALYTVQGFWCFLIVLGYGILNYLVFELLINLFGSFFKDVMPAKREFQGFLCLFRLVYIFVNSVIFILNFLILYINFYAPYAFLIFTVFVNFFALMLIYFILQRNLFKSNFNAEFSKKYFIFMFIYLIVSVLFWG